MKKIIKRIIDWLYSEDMKAMEEELENFRKQAKRLDTILNEVDVSVSVEQRSRSWAVISIQGERSDFIKFINLNNQDIYDVHRFLSQYDRKNNITIDAAPSDTAFLKMKR
jgi:hypothetical protein